MPTLTPNLGLKKPQLNETADIAVLNENMDVIDAQIFEHKNAAAPHPGHATVSALDAHAGAAAPHSGYYTRGEVDALIAAASKWQA